MNWNSLIDWFIGLGADYGVDPVVFGAIYVGAIPFFTLSVAWLVRNARARRSIVVPIFSASLFFVSAYLYLIVAGQAIPTWVYAFIAIVIGFGAFSTVKKIKDRVARVA